MKGSMIGIGIAVATLIAFISSLIGFVAGIGLITWAQDRATTYSGRMRYQRFQTARQTPEP